MNEAEIQGFIIIGGIVAVVCTLAWFMHERDERRYYREMRQKAEAQRDEIIRKITKGEI